MTKHYLTTIMGVIVAGATWLASNSTGLEHSIATVIATVATALIGVFAADANKTT